MRTVDYPVRKNIALPGYDYRTPNSYFVTLRVHRGQCLFGDIVDGEMRLNDFGRIVEEEWLRTAEIRPHVKLDAHVVMPNHIHGILDIVKYPDAEGPAMLEKRSGPASGSLSAILGQFKGVTSKRCRARGHTASHPLWLRRWHDRVIRSDPEKAAIRGYIWDNPVRWEQRRKMWQDK